MFLESRHSNLSRGSIGLVAPYPARCCDRCDTLFVLTLFKGGQYSPKNTPPLMPSFTGTSLQYPILQHIARKLCDTPFFSRAAERGGFKRGGGSRSGFVLSFLSFFVLFGTFPIFLGFSRFARGLFGDFPDLPLSSFLAYQEHLQGTVPKGSATQSAPFPKKKVGNPPVWKPPGLASLNFRCVPTCVAKTCAAHPVFARVAGELGAADPRIYSKGP